MYSRLARDAGVYNRIFGDDDPEAPGEDPGEASPSQDPGDPPPAADEAPEAAGMTAARFMGRLLYMTDREFAELRDLCTAYLDDHGSMIGFMGYTFLGYDD